MNILKKAMDFVAPEVDPEEQEEEQYLELTEEEAKILTGYEEPANKSVRYDTKATMVLFEPRSFDEAEEIARHLTSKRAALINLHRLPREYSQRTIDFLTGVVFALNGTIQKVGANVILCAPASIGVDGEINIDDVE